MALALLHVLNALYQRYVRKLWGGRPADGAQRTMEAGRNEDCAGWLEALWSLQCAQSFSDLWSAGAKALSSLLESETAGCLLFCRDADCEEDGCLRAADSGVDLPLNSQTLRVALDRRCLTTVTKITQDDPLLPVVLSIADCSTHTNARNFAVHLLPVIEPATDKPLFVILAREWGPEQARVKKTLSIMAEQISSCCARIKCSDSVGDGDIMKLCAELNDIDAGLLQVKLLKFLKEKTAAESGFLLICEPDGTALICQVIDDRVLLEELCVPLTDTPTLAASCKNHRPVVLNDPPEHVKREIGEMAHACDVRSMLCVPIVQHGSVVALAVMLNSLRQLGRRPSHEVASSGGGLPLPHRLAAAVHLGFSERDVRIVQSCFKYTGTVLTTTLAYQTEQRLKTQTEALLKIARNLFTHLDDLTVLLREIMHEARNLTNAERCSVFLLDRHANELVAKVFDGDLMDGHDQSNEIRFPAAEGIAGHVVTTGVTLNIRDAYAHPLFYRAVDEYTGYRTRNILCFPIKDEKETIVGAAQLCNKKNGPYFSSYDEDVARAFSVYCCISIVHSLMYQNVVDAHNRVKLSTELMIYHMQVPQEDVEELSGLSVPPVHQFDPVFDDFSCLPRCLAAHDMPVAVLSMFQDLGFTASFRIKHSTLARFVLMVRRGYRDPPYHNWNHAFSVTHFAYLAVKNFDVIKRQYLEEIETLAYFVASLCHDIDHRGTTNSFQVASKSVLAALYSSEGSVMERHHFAQTMCVLNSEGCNIFENVSRKEYEQLLDLIRDIILATDIAHHLRIMPDLQAMASNGYDRGQPEHRSLLLCLLMTAADLSDQTKPWRCTRGVAKMIYREFFSQGDLEKALGVCPSEMMDRDRAHIPKLQIDFIDHIVAPLYDCLSTLFPVCRSMMEVIEDNKLHWFDVHARATARRISTNSLEVLTMINEEELEENGSSKSHSTQPHRRTTAGGCV